MPHKSKQYPHSSKSVVLMAGLIGIALQEVLFDIMRIIWVRWVCLTSKLGSLSTEVTFLSFEDNRLSNGDRQPVTGGSDRNSLSSTVPCVVARKWCVAVFLPLAFEMNVLICSCLQYFVPYLYRI